MDRKKTLKPGKNAATLSRLRAIGDRLRMQSIGPAAITGICLTAAAAGALLSYSEKAAQSEHLKVITKSSSKIAPPKGAAVLSLHTAGLTKDSKAAPASNVRRSVEFYTGDVRATMFSEPVAPAPPAPAPVVEAKVEAPAPPDPYADWNYTGSATIGTEKYAMIENVDSHDGYLLRVGDTLPPLDVKVAEIGADDVTFGGKSPKTLRVSFNTSYIPLSNSADFLKTKAAPDANGQVINGQITAEQLAAMMAARGAGGAGFGGGRGGGRGGRGGGGGGGFGGGGGGRRNRGGGFGGGFGGFGGG